jgi:hypothetical protein
MNNRLNAFRNDGATNAKKSDRNSAVKPAFWVQKNPAVSRVFSYTRENAQRITRFPKNQGNGS